MCESLCVCFVDDEPDILVPIQLQLERLGIKSHTFATADALLQSEALKRAACVVVDFQPRETSGLALLQELRRLDYRMPVIMTAGAPSAADAIQAFESGATAFFEKPFDIEKFVAAVQRAKLSRS